MLFWAARGTYRALYEVSRALGKLAARIGDRATLWGPWPIIDPVVAQAKVDEIERDAKLRAALAAASGLVEPDPDLRVEVYEVEGEARELIEGLIARIRDRKAAAEARGVGSFDA